MLNIRLKYIMHAELITKKNIMYVELNRRKGGGPAITCCRFCVDCVGGRNKNNSNMKVLMTRSAHYLSN